MKTPSKFRLSYLLEHGILAFLTITAVCLVFLVAATLLNSKYEVLLGIRLFTCIVGCLLLAGYFAVATPRAQQWLFAIAVINITAHVIITHSIYLNEGWTLIVPYFGIKLLAIAAALAAPAISLPVLLAFFT